MKQLVPDLLLVHVDQRCIIDETDLNIEVNLVLGEGSFGIVYRAKYRHKNVAVKVWYGIVYGSLLSLLNNESFML